MLRDPAVERAPSARAIKERDRGVVQCDLDALEAGDRRAHVRMDDEDDVHLTRLDVALEVPRRGSIARAGSYGGIRRTGVRRAHAVGVFRVVKDDVEAVVHALRRHLKVIDGDGRRDENERAEITKLSLPVTRLQHRRQHAEADGLSVRRGDPMIVVGFWPYVAVLEESRG